MLYEELWQYFSDVCKRQLPEVDFDNISDVGYLLVGWLAIVRQLSLGTRELEKPLMSVWCAMVWLKALYDLRGESFMGPRLLPILAALKDTFAFFFLTGVCVAAAAHAYYNLELRDEPSPMYAAIIQVVRLGLFGDFDLFEFEGLDPTLRQNNVTDELEPVDPEPGSRYTSAHTLFYCTGLGITILLMNVLIAVLSQNFELYQGRSEILFQRARAKMLRQLQDRPWAYVLRLLPSTQSGSKASGGTLRISV